MIRLQIVIPTLDQSGAEKQFALLATRLPKTEFEVEVLTLNRGGPYEDLLTQHQIPYTILNKKSRFDPRNLLTVRKHLKSRRPDVVLSCLFSANATTRIATWNWNQRPKLLISERCVDSWKSGWQLQLDRLLRSQTDRLIGNSKSVADFYRQQGFDNSKTVVIPNGIEVPPLPDITREEFLQKHNLPADAFLIAAIGRLAPQKNLKVLIWAAHLAYHANKRFRLLIIGDGPQRDKLIQYAKEVDAEPMIKFLGHQKNAGSLLHFMDSYWLGSHFEGMSNSLMEAMSCGLPVVVSDIPPNRELVTHNVHGWIIDPQDSTGFAQYSLQLLKDPELAKSVGARGAERMKTEFSIDRMVESYANLIREVAGH